MKDSRWNHRVTMLGSIGVLALLQGAQAVTIDPGRSAAHAFELPLTFEENKGQTNGRVEFLARGPGYNIFLTATEAVLTLPRSTAARGTVSVIRMQLVGAVAAPKMEGIDALPGTVNYFRGRTAASWRTNVPIFKRVHYSAVYPGVDLVYYGQRQQLEYDFIVAPGANPGTIKLAFAGVEQTTVDAGGDLVLKAAGEPPLRFRKPVIYQVDGNRRHIVEGGYVRRGAHQIGFRVGAYDRTRPLIIDPILSYSTYLGGSGIDYANGIAVDATGAVYVSGFTTSADFPTANAMQPARNASSDLFVAKLTADGKALVYATYLGGSADEGGGDIAVDSTGAAYVIGFSSSSDFPTVNALQPGNGGDRDAIIAKLSADGSRLIYSTYLGRGGYEAGHAIAVDVAGAAHIAGATQSLDFPLVNPLQPTLSGVVDAFVAKLAPDGGALLYSTYLGGSLIEEATDIAVDSLGAAYVTGYVEADAGFPVVNPLPGPGGGTDAFASKISPDGMRLIYSSPLGGISAEEGRGIVVDASGAAYVTGSTDSSDFPTTNALQPQRSGMTDAFVVKIAPEGGAMIYSTFLGGLQDDFPNDITVDAAGSAHIAGHTYSPDFPTMNAIQQTLAGVDDAFVSQFSADGASLVNSTYLGGREQDWGIAIAVDLTGALYVAGQTRSDDFPTTASLLPACSGRNNNAFVAKITQSSPARPASTAVPLTADSNISGSARAGGGGAMDALFVKVLALFAMAGAMRRRRAARCAAPAPS